ncbi:MAG TPA: 4-hydroxy-2-oxoheptanedioate aldolase [Nevskiaceae bacterium]
MEQIRNPFKRGLKEGKLQIGFWTALADAYVAEILATVGYDWLLIDNEHAPNDVRTTLAQLQAIAPYHSHAIVRPAENETALIKRYLDIGTQTLLVPMINTPEQARAAVAATRYPPDGIRGVGSALARASRWNRVSGYLHSAADELCMLVQAETTQAVGNLAAIAAVDGVDGVFFGPADLSASMGLIGKPGDERVVQTVCDGIRTVCQTGKAAGVLTSDQKLVRRYIDAGATFVAVGNDIGILGAGAKQLLDAWSAHR